MNNGNASYQIGSEGPPSNSGHRGRFQGQHRGSSNNLGRGRGASRGRTTGRGATNNTQPHNDDYYVDNPSNQFPSNPRGISRPQPSNPNNRGNPDYNQNNTGGPNPGGKHTLVPVKPNVPGPVSTTSWRVLYMVPNTRHEIGPSGEKIPGPFSPPLRPSTPEPSSLMVSKKPQDVLRKQNETHLMKQRVQQLLQQAANSPVGKSGYYVGKLSQNNNCLIPVLPRPDL